MFTAECMGANQWMSMYIVNDILDGRSLVLSQETGGRATMLCNSYEYFYFQVHVKLLLRKRSCKLQQPAHIYLNTAIWLVPPIFGLWNKSVYRLVTIFRPRTRLCPSNDIQVYAVISLVPKVQLDCKDYKAEVHGGQMVSVPLMRPERWLLVQD